MRKTVSLVIILLCFIGLLASCSEPATGSESTAGKDEESAKQTTASENETNPSASIALDTNTADIPIGGYVEPAVTVSADGTDQKILWATDNAAVAVVDDTGRIIGKGEGQCVVTACLESTSEAAASITVNVTNPTNTQGLTYINGILVVNKTYALPSTYSPDVDSEAYAALMEMFQAAKADGISLTIVSGYRSYERQNTLYNNYVAKDGVEAADTYSARAGHSEHQTGLAFDLNSLEESFGETKEGIWLREHCWEYGFIIRYPKGKEDITGYMYEPWHVRYLGKSTAKSVFESGLCLEEYLNVTSVYAQ